MKSAQRAVASISTGKELKGEYMEFDGKILCTPCLEAELGICEKCKEPIDGEFMECFDCKFHPKCLTCIVCKVELSRPALRRDDGGKKKRTNALCRVLQEKNQQVYEMFQGDPSR